MGLYNEKTGYWIDNEKGIASEVTFPFNLNVLRHMFKTDDLVMPKYFLGMHPYRILCKSNPKPKDNPTILTNEGKALINGPVFILGATSTKDGVRSLTKDETAWFIQHTVLRPIDAYLEGYVDYSQIGYTIKGFSEEPVFTIEGD